MATKADHLLELQTPLSRICVPGLPYQLLQHWKPTGHSFSRRLMRDLVRRDCRDAWKVWFTCLLSWVDYFQMYTSLGYSVNLASAAWNSSASSALVGTHEFDCIVGGRAPQALAITQCWSWGFAYLQAIMWVPQCKWQVHCELGRHTGGIKVGSS